MLKGIYYDFLLVFCALMIIGHVLFVFIYKKRFKYLTDTKEKLYNLREKVIGIKDKAEIYQHILEAAIDMVPKATKGSILIEEKDKLLHYVALVGYPEKLRDITLKKEEAFLYAKNQCSDIAIIKDPAKFNKYIVHIDKQKLFEETEALDIHCTLSCPININDKTIGIINLDNTKDNTKFSEDDIKHVKHIINELKLVLRVFLIQEDLRYQSNFDALTGIYNRRYLEYLINYQLEILKENKTKASFVFIDLDNFKIINDTYGHNAGDNALVFMANILKNKLDDTNIFGRIAGDEFIIFFPNVCKTRAVEIVEDIRSSYIKEKISDMTLDFSYGIIEISEASQTLSDLIEVADKKMYLKKKFKKCKTPFH